MVARGSELDGGAPILSEKVKLAIFLVMAVGQFMALLDIQIVAASMGAIQAGLSAGADEIDWVQTAYLMAEIVMIPLSAFLAQALTTRWMFVISAGLFTLSSLMCGLAGDLPTMIAFRAVQGFVGGAMIPLVFATGFLFFEGRKRAMVTAVLGVISTLAPTLGPTIGGWITDTASWRWLFFINIVPGLLVTVALTLLGKTERARPALLAHVDWLHVASLATFLGGLQYVLQEGPRHQWFNDKTTAGVAWLAVVAAVVFFERCFFARRPIVRLGAFRRPGFAAACLLGLVVGFGLYTIVYLTPVFLARVRGYSSLQIGETVVVAGISMTLAAPIAAWLSARIDQRLVMAGGLILYAASFWMISAITKDWGFSALFWTQTVRGVAVLFCMIPAVGMALNTIPEAELRDASGLNSLMRNLGGAVGIALVNTWLIDFAQLHLLRLSEAMGAAPEAATQAVSGLARRLAPLLADPQRAATAAKAMLGQMVGATALVQAFQDVFRLCAYVFIAALIFVPFCRAGSLASSGSQQPRRQGLTH